MNVRCLVLTAVFLGSTLTGGMQAHASYKDFQPYIAVSGGVEHLGGKRTDFINEDDLSGTNTLVTTFFSANKSLSNTSTTLSFLAGFTWKPTELPIVVGPEIHIGRGATRSKFTDSRQDFNVPPLFRYYTSELERRFNYGIVARAGYQCLDYLLSVVVGYDYGRFKETRALTDDPENRPVTKISKTKGLSGLILGAGVEKKFQNFAVGIDFRYTKYAKFTSNQTFDFDPGNILPSTLGFSARPKIYATTLRISYQF